MTMRVKGLMPANRVIVPAIASATSSPTRTRTPRLICPVDRACRAQLPDDLGCEGAGAFPEKRMALRATPFGASTTISMLPPSDCAETRSPRRARPAPPPSRPGLRQHAHDPRHPRRTRMGRRSHRRRSPWTHPTVLGARPTLRRSQAQHDQTPCTQRQRHAGRRSRKRMSDRSRLAAAGPLLVGWCHVP